MSEIVHVAPAAVAHRSRWGYHSISRESFLKLKSLRKWYWETVYAEAALRRWERKTVHQAPVAPKCCSVFIEEATHVVLCKRRHGNGEEFTHYDVRPRKLHDYGILQTYALARRPAVTPEECPRLVMSEQEIERLYAQVDSWISEQES